jgi:hypothetical protein
MSRTSLGTVIKPGRCSLRFVRPPTRKPRQTDAGPRLSFICIITAGIGFNRQSVKSKITAADSSLFEEPPGLRPFSNYTMSTVIDFDEKKFWIVLFSIVARREAARESGIGRNRRARPWLRVIRNPTQDSDSDAPDRMPYQCRT